MILKNNILYFENLSKFGSITHGISTRFFGSMRPRHPEHVASIEKFTKALNILPEDIVRMDQRHSDVVHWVSESDIGKIIEITDAMATEKKGIFLAVVVGDCIPLLFYDPKMKFVAVVHAGWRGLFNEIVKITIKNLIMRGSSPDDIVVGIGPCIRACCYGITKVHAEKLLDKFPGWEKFIIDRDGKLFLDLPEIAIDQLSTLGILSKNIEDADYCTFDHKDLYSYRREGESFGEIMGIIGLV